MQILYIFSTFQTRQGQYIIHHNTWPHPQLLALTLKRCKCFIEFHFTMLLSSLVAFVCAYGPVSCLSCLPAQVPEASHIHFIPYAHCKRSVSTPAHIHLPGMLQAVFHQIMSQTFPHPPLSLRCSHHVAMALHRDIRQTPRIGCRFPSCFHLLLVPKEGNNVVMSFNKLSDPLMEGWQSLPVATN